MHSKAGRILIISNSYPPNVVGGAEIIVANLAGWLATSGWQVTVVGSYVPPSGCSDTVEDGVRLIRYFPTNPWWSFDSFRAACCPRNLGKLAWQVRDAWNRQLARALGTILHELQPDIAHTHNIKGMSPGIWAQLRKQGIPIVHTLHDYYLICRAGTMLGRLGGCKLRCIGCAAHASWYIRQANRLDAICAPSEFIKDRHARFGVRGRRGLQVVPDGILDPANVPWRSRTAGGLLRLLYVDQLRRDRGAHLLPLIARSLNRTAQIDVVGTGPLAPILAKAAAEIGPDALMKLHGFVDGPAKTALFDAADALLLPSQWAENAPFVVLEAFARGLPVLASRIGAIPELVQHGVNGLLCAPHDLDGYAAQAARLRREPDLWATLSRGALASARRFSIAAMGQHYLELYHRLLREQLADNPQSLDNSEHSMAAE